MKRSKAPTEATEGQRLSRSRGALMGLAVGEALGIPYENRHISAEDFPTLNDMEVEMLGGGPNNVKRGQTTWGTQMAVVLANHLRESRMYDVEAVAKGYVEWRPLALDLPDTVKQGLDLIAEHRHPETTGYRVWLENGQRPKDNAALVRTVPLAVFFAKNRAARFLSTVQDTHITHFSPQVTLAGAVFNGVLAAAILSPGVRLANDGVINAAQSELNYAAAELSKIDGNWVQMIRDSAEWLREDLKFAQATNPELYGPDLQLLGGSTWVRVAFRLAFWELFHAPNTQLALLDVVNRGGDADTNAAVTGALMGAVYGENSIPQEWRETVLEGVGHMAGPLWDSYHPRFLLNLAAIEPNEPEPGT